MENNEIYIDGVNVAGCCKCLNVEQNILCGVSGICANNPNCYYKQLKRLEQERNEWKKKYEDAANENLKEIYELIKKNDCWRGVVNVVCGKLEQENRELKAYKDVNEDFKKAWDELNEKHKRYRSALEEIREELCYGRTFYEGYFDRENLSRTDKVIKKINGVLG